MHTDPMTWEQATKLASVIRQEIDRDQYLLLDPVDWKILAAIARVPEPSDKVQGLVVALVTAENVVAREVN